MRRRTKPTERTQRLFDGLGLYLEITPTGGRLWRYKYRFGSKEKLLSLGTLEQKSLKEARAAHRDARELVASGVNPSVVRKIEKARELALQR